MAKFTSVPSMFLCCIHPVSPNFTRLNSNQLFYSSHKSLLLTLCSGGFRNSERGVQPLVREVRPQILVLPRPLPVTLEVRIEYLEATLGLVKCLEISKELIRECVTMPGCCCCMPLLHNHLMDSCSYNYVRQNTLLAAKGGCICTPLTPPESATALMSTLGISATDILCKGY